MGERIGRRSRGRTRSRRGSRTCRSRRGPVRRNARARNGHLVAYLQRRALCADKQEELCRAALPVEEERGDPRRLALLWELLGKAAQDRMRNDDVRDALEQALRYRRLAGDFPTDEGIDWSLILGSRAADDGLRMLDELAAERPPGAADLARAVLLAMLGRIDEAWPLAEARSNHLRDIGGGWSASSTSR